MIDPAHVVHEDGPVILVGVDRYTGAIVRALPSASADPLELDLALGLFTERVEEAVLLADLVNREVAGRRAALIASYMQVDV